MCLRSLATRIELNATVKKVIAIKKDANKIWTSVDGGHLDTDNAEVFDQLALSSFDGKVYRQAISSSRVPFGLGAIGEKGTPLEILSLTLYFRPIIWWCDPKSAMPALGANFQNLRISTEEISVALKPCIELEVVHEGIARASIYVTKESPYLPLEISVYSRQQKVSSKYEFAYAEDAVGPTRLASWSVIYFDATGDVSRQQDGKVLEFIHGKRLGNDDFSLRFPVGTNIKQYTKGRPKFWIQSSPNKMEPLDEKDYGKHPPGRKSPASGVSGR
jgi:hypothetical protein